MGFREELSSRIQHTMKLLLVIAAAVVAQASGDWTGSGRLQCYGHLYTDVTTPPGGGYLEHGKVQCNPVEWPYPQQDLGPEAMFFAPNNGPELKSGLGITTHPTFPARSA